MTFCQTTICLSFSLLSLYIIYIFCFEGIHFETEIKRTCSILSENKLTILMIFYLAYNVKTVWQNHLPYIADAYSEHIQPSGGTQLCKIALSGYWNWAHHSTSFSMMEAVVRRVGSMDAGPLSRSFCWDVSFCIRSNAVWISWQCTKSSLISCPKAAGWSVSAVAPYWGLSLGLCGWQLGHPAMVMAKSALVSGFPCDWDQGNLLPSHHGNLSS